LDSFIVWLAEVLAVKFPKATELGVTLIAGVDAVTPVPVRLTVTVEALALLEIVTLPEAAPVVAG
jgi:hypothetical protein